MFVPLNPESGIPMYEQIYEYIKHDILHGVLPQNTKLPSQRNLSKELSISRSTVNTAYEQLLSEGYIFSKEKSGFFVSDIRIMQSFPATDTLPTICPVDKKTYTFSPFSVDTDSFPYATWRKLTNNVIGSLSADALSLGDSNGDFIFRKAIADYLAQSRGVTCSPDQIIIGAGTDYLLMLLCGLFEDHLPIAMENPTYIRAYQVFRGLNKTVLPVPVTESGMDISYLKESNASIAYVTPSHQYPLGAVMPVSSRHELIAWAEHSMERYIIEDDHDSEFRYKGLPIPSLQGMAPKKVIYLGTFSRAIAPAIRVSYMVLPVALLTEYQKRFSHYSSTVSRVDQSILTAFIKDGYLERHLNKMRKNYHQKHDFMLKSLRCFKDTIIVSGENAGLHLVVSFQNGMTEEEITERAKNAGICLYSVKEHEIIPGANKHPTFLFGFAGLSEKEIAENISKLHSALS